MYCCCHYLDVGPDTVKTDYTRFLSCEPYSVGLIAARPMVISMVAIGSRMRPTSALIVVVKDSSSYYWANG